jgi:FtsP/CotA-like multicopper oxidase with cupredoxin domain
MNVIRNRRDLALAVTVSIVVIAGFILSLTSVTPVMNPSEVQAQPTAVREFTLITQETNWQLAPDQMFEAWTYNGTVPGPEIRVQEGELVRVTLKNELPAATSLHWHGIDVPNTMDGGPNVTQKPIQPGETYTYEFIARPAGTRFYHSHGKGEEFSEAEQLDRGLYGAFIIEHAEASREIIEPGRRTVASPSTRSFDREYTLFLDEWRGGAHGAHGVGDYRIFTFNGKAFPLTTPLKVKQGERVRVRLINVGTTAFHPIHLHGHQFKIVATDGNPVPFGLELTKNTITVMPGETYDIEFVASNPGTWVLHCHELHHAGGGMVTLVQYVM